MSVLLTILLVLAVLVVVLGVGGYVATARRTGAREDKLLEQLRKAERELAKAHAADKGWDPATVEAAARQAAQARFGSGVTSLQLVQVIDKPGTEADQAVFRVQTADGEHAITLGRSGGVWGPA
jgi:type II secretory pathway pseudopilin PulG